MKPFSSKLISLFLILAFTSGASAQFTHSGRGMYVDKFFRTSIDPNGNNVINPTLSILGIPSKENDLLRYAKQNHITYLVLYDLHHVLGNPTYESYLCSFLEKAKTQYCIEKIGVASSCASMFDNVISIQPSPAFVFSDPDSSGLQAKLGFVNEKHQPGDSMFYVSEAVKMNLRASAFNDECPYKFDVLVTEYEFWLNTADDCTGEFLSVDEKYERYQRMITYMDQIRDDYNSGHTDQLFIETYLGYLNQNLAYSHQDIADWIDGTYGGKRRVDRINLHYYAGDPSRMYSQNSAGANHWGYYQTRFFDFSQGSTVQRTNIHPIFSSEHIPWGAHNDFLGPWFYQSINNNIFTAEKMWYDDWYDDATVQNPFTIGDSILGNVIQPGGVQWFTSSMMAGHLDNPVMFTSNSPVCVPAGQSGHFSFQYQGPIEEGVWYKFYLTDTGSATLRCGMTDSIPWPAYDPVTRSSIDLNAALGGCSLPAGEYDAHLELKYNSECNTCTANCSLYVAPVVKVKVTHSGNIVALTSTSVCNGSPVFLRASSSATGLTSYQWYDNGTLIPGANSSIFSVPASATGNHNYFCNINSTVSGCSANPSNAIPVSLSPGFAASITTQPAGGCSITMTAHPPGALYQWSDGTTGQTLTTAYSGIYNVSVTLNGCTDMTSYIHQSLNYDNLTVFNNCSGAQTGAIQLNIFGGSPPYTISYTGPVSGSITGLQTGNNTISALASGTYSITLTDASGCTSTVTPNPLITNDHATLWYRDADGDGYGDLQSTVFNCNPPPGYVGNFDDCDDTDPAYNNGAGCPLRLSLKLYIQGFYAGAGLMRPVLYNNGLSADINACDSIIVELHKTSAPYSLQFARKILMFSDGTAEIKIPDMYLGESFFIAIRHRNSLETWTSTPVTLNAYSLNYNFTTTSSKAFGSNQAVLPDGKYAFWSGDVSDGTNSGFQDGIINIAIDYAEVKNAAEHFLTGYLAEDLTGDVIVESADFSIVENNGLPFITIIKP